MAPRRQRTGPAASLAPSQSVPAPTSTTESIPDAALAYCAAGWSVIPCRVTGKRALVRWRPWQQTPPDPEQLRLWWRRWPRANVAVICGRVSGVLVVDVDPRHGGDRALAELERERGTLPRLAVVETPSGGQHLYFAHPGGRIPNSAGRLARGVDVRADGGIALLPPSRRHDGEYRWELGGPATVPELPAAWIELLRPPPRRAVAGTRKALRAAHDPGGHHDSARLAGLVRAVRQAPEGRRNALLYWAGCRAAEAGPPAGWREALEQAGKDAGLDTAEVGDTLDSALGRAEP